MKHTGLFKTLCFCAGCLLLSACVDYSDIQPFDGKTLPRKSGYTTGVTNDWIYFNLRTGEVFNALGVNRDIKEGGQMNRTDWDLAFCGYVMVRVGSVGEELPIWAMGTTKIGQVWLNYPPI